MESNGVTGNIMVSEAAKKMIEKHNDNEYSFEWQTDVEIKAIDGLVSGYLIYKRNAQN